MKNTATHNKPADSKRMTKQIDAYAQRVFLALLSKRTGFKAASAAATDMSFLKGIVTKMLSISRMDWCPCRQFFFTYLF
jgi:hypothetical protein